MNSELKKLILIVIALLLVNAWNALTHAQTKSSDIPWAVEINKAEQAPYSGILMPKERFDIADSCIDHLSICESSLLKSTPESQEEDKIFIMFSSIVIGFGLGVAADHYLLKP